MVMPKVGSKEFPYSKEGMNAAREEAAKSGKKMVMPKKAAKTKAAAKKVAKKKVAAKRRAK
jgi:hypothetical protein